MLFLFGILILSLLVAITIYILVSLFLNKLNHLIYGRGTALSFIPICNIYLLGKLTLGKGLGWLLIFCLLLTGTYTIEINGVEKVYTILPDTISSWFLGIYNLFVFGLFIYAIFKYKKLKESNL